MIAYCQECGELIPNATPREGSTAKHIIYVCEACWEPWLIPPNSGGMGSAAEKTDMDYHGGLFNRGEW